MQPFNWSNLSIAAPTAGAQCLPFVSCPSVLSTVTSFVACGGGQSMSATPAAVNLSAGAQCLPFVSCPSVLSTVGCF
ncbi:hypothetical protein, partial [Brevibacillus formosus]|uniref:hypothetical protein n=1 Tax=Brevibacillus formosus TaxID=54913 RepID=UPI003D25DF7B